MNDYPVVLFALVLAVNLFLAGAGLTGGLALSFRFIGNVFSPRLRYIISVGAISGAAFIPLIISFNSFYNQKSLFEIIIETKRTFPAQTSFVRENPLAEAAASAGFIKGDEITLAALPNRFALVLANSPIGAIFVCFWILGAFYFLSRELLAHRHLGKARKLWSAATNSERKELLCPDEIPVYFDENETPGTIGFFSSQIVLPKCFNELSMDARHFIFQHELSHARWRDPLINSILRIIRAIFWVSPAVWLLERQIRVERESAADFAAILKCSVNNAEYQTTALNFADTLVAAAKRFNAAGLNNKKNLIMGIGRESTFENRIRRLLNYSRPVGIFRLVLASIAIFISGTGLLGICLAAQPINLVMAGAGSGNETSVLSDDIIKQDFKVAEPAITEAGTSSANASGSRKKGLLTSWLCPIPID